MANNEELEHRAVVNYSTDEHAFEMLYDNGKASLAVRDRYGKVRVVDKMVVNLGNDKVVLHPLLVRSRSPIANRTVLLPSRPLPYSSVQKLIELIKAHIHGYLELSPVDEEIAAYYVLLTWRYDFFGALPYLRFHGDWGAGKSRALQTIGSICYRPMFVAGATGPAPIFRMIDRYQGTLILDEADNMGDEVIKILNCGYKTGTPVIRCDKDTSFDPVSYLVYGPKIIGTRQRFRDVALESRCLTIQIQSRTRTDIPVSLLDMFWWKARQLRNMLLMYRFDHLESSQQVLSDNDGLEPRLQETWASLKEVIGDNPPLVAEIKKKLKENQDQLRQDGAVSVEGYVIASASELISEHTMPTMKAIADRAGKALGYPLSSQRVGGIIRSLGLNLAKPKGHVSLSQDAQNIEKLKRMRQRYDIK
jgi:hypothetical protein